MLSDKEKNRVLVYYPIPESPAERAGLKAGDYIISVDGKEYTSEDLAIISDYIKGKEGTKVKLVIERNNEKIDFEIEREKINTNPITSKILDGKIGYLKLPSFDQSTAENFKTKLQELKANGAESLILDLRNNGGGIVDEATKIADYFLEKGETIITTVDNKRKEEKTISEKAPIFNMNIVILANGNSASASEILICGLVENNKAKVVGTKTYGKGIIQTILSLADGSGLKITTQEYYTPQGKQIHKKGIEPTEEVKLPESIKNIYALSQEDDTQLKRAIEILKGN